MKILFWIKKQFSKGTFPDVYIQSPSYIRSNVEIGRYTYIMSNSNIYSNVRIGRYCSIAPNVLIGATSHPVNWLSSHIFQIERPTYFKGGGNIKTKRYIPTKAFKGTTIGNDVWLGANCIIMQGVTVGDGAIIGAGAVVTKDIPPYAIAVGVPAKVVKYRFDEQQIKLLQKLEWWNLNYEELDGIEFDNINMAIKQLQDRLLISSNTREHIG